MGVCESLFNNSSSSTNENKYGKRVNQPKIPLQKINQTLPQNHQKGNYYHTPIGDSNTNFNQLNLSQSQMTVGNNSYYPPQKVKPFIYVNKYKQNNNLQTSLATGSLHGPNNYSSITSGNKGESRISDNNMSTSGEFIVDGEINKNMEGDKDFNNFMDLNNKDIMDDFENIFDDHNENKNTNTNKNNINKYKKDVNYYHKKNLKNNKNSNNHLKEIKERNSEKESSENQQPPIPLDTIE